MGGRLVRGRQVLHVHLDRAIRTAPALFAVALVYVSTKLEGTKVAQLKPQQNLSKSLTHAVSGALLIRIVTRALGLVDKRKNADASLVKADEVASAPSTVAYQTHRWQS